MKILIVFKLKDGLSSVLLNSFQHLLHESCYNCWTQNLYENGLKGTTFQTLASIHKIRISVMWCSKIRATVLEILLI